MNKSHDMNLESQLREATSWRGAAPNPPLWVRAMEHVADERGTTRIARNILLWPMPKALAAAIVVLLSGSVITALLVRSTGNTHGRSTAVASSQPIEASSSDDLMGAITPNFNGSPGLDVNSALELHSTAKVLESYGNKQLEGFGQGGGGGGGRNLYSAIVAENLLQSEDPVTADRSVVRKATLELITDDVRSAFIKSMHIVSEAGGEYVQDSSLTGEGKNAQAMLTLRIAADRLSAALNELREFGKVQTERITGEDVTAQMVDLDARLRNELRVEKELLELMDRRADAPLKEILELRTQTSVVRQTIEQLSAQKERLGRLVSLATILLIIRPQPEPEPEPAKPQTQSLAEYFSESVDDSWSGGLRYLADTLAGALKVLVGGLMWWLILIVAFVILRQHLQRRAVQ